MRYGTSAPNRRMGRGRNMKTRTYLAELLGTFLFMMLGYASVAGSRTRRRRPRTCSSSRSRSDRLLAAIFSFGGISGGHFNPAVTVAMVLDRRTEPVDGVGYVVAQIDRRDRSRCTQSWSPSVRTRSRPGSPSRARASLTSARSSSKRPSPRSSSS